MHRNSYLIWFNDLLFSIMVPKDMSVRENLIISNQYGCQSFYQATSRYCFEGGFG